MHPSKSVAYVQLSMYVRRPTAGTSLKGFVLLHSDVNGRVSHASQAEDSVWLKSGNNVRFHEFFWIVRFNWQLNIVRVESIRFLWNKWKNCSSSLTYEFFHRWHFVAHDPRISNTRRGGCDNLSYRHCHRRHSSDCRFIFYGSFYRLSRTVRKKNSQWKIEGKEIKRHDLKHSSIFFSFLNGRFSVGKKMERKRWRGEDWD